MIIPIAALVVVLVPAAFGGRLTRLAQVRLRSMGLLAGALLAQIAIVEVLTGPQAVLAAVHVASYAGAGWFLWANRRIPGLLVVTAGALSNAAAIVANGGVLPASPRALAVAGLADAAGFSNSAAVHDPRLWFLGDVFAIPSGWPLANVFSLGDVVILLGAGFASVRISGTRWSDPWSAADAGHALPRHRRGLARGPRRTHDTLTNGADRGDQGVTLTHSTRRSPERSLNPSSWRPTNTTSCVDRRSTTYSKVEGP